MSDRYFMDIAKRTAQESKCKKKKVACVIVKDNDIVATGRNGTLPGKPNICEANVVVCPNCGNFIYPEEFTRKENKYGQDIYEAKCGNCFTTNAFIDEIKTELKTLKWTIHAEPNAIKNAHAKGVNIKDSTFYITLSPCVECAKLIANYEVKRVVYLETYKDTEGIEFLKDYGIIVEQYQEDNYEQD